MASGVTKPVHKRQSDLGLKLSILVSQLLVLFKITSCDKIHCFKNLKENFKNRYAFFNIIIIKIIKQRKYAAMLESDIPILPDT